jgi:predicted dinucleotide-binding enzyme
VFAADTDARATAEQLIRDAGCEALYVGGLENAPTLEAQIAFAMMRLRWLRSSGPRGRDGGRRLWLRRF